MRVKYLFIKCEIPRFQYGRQRGGMSVEEDGKVGRFLRKIGADKAARVAVKNINFGIHLFVQSVALQLADIQMRSTRTITTTFLINYLLIFQSAYIVNRSSNEYIRMNCKL